MPGVIKSEMADYVAVCELDANASPMAWQIVEKSYTDRGMKAPQIRTFDNYRELVGAQGHRRGRHQHARSLACGGGARGDQCRQGRLSTEAVHHDTRRGRDPARRGQTHTGASCRWAASSVRGSSSAARPSSSVRVASATCSAWRSACPPIPRRPTPRPRPSAEGLDYGQWLGPTPFKYYTEMRVHPRKDYSRPGWLRHEAHCLGMITGWGSHHYDTMHWASSSRTPDRTTVEGKGDFPDPERIWNVHGAYDVTLRIRRT